MEEIRSNAQDGILRQEASEQGEYSSCVQQLREAADESNPLFRPTVVLYTSLEVEDDKPARTAFPCNLLMPCNLKGYRSPHRLALPSFGSLLGRWLCFCHM